jgi:hypothetical protein
LLVTVAPKKRELLASLTPAIGASGPHVFAVRYRRARQSQLKRPSLPDPRFVTNAHAPLRWDGMAQEVKLICLRDQARSSATHWHDGQLKKCCQVLFDGPMHFPSPLVREGDSEGDQAKLSRKMPSFDNNRLSAPRNLTWTPKVLRQKVWSLTSSRRRGKF